MSESVTSRWRARMTDENAVVVTSILVALPSVVLIDEFLGGATGVVFMLTLGVGIVPAIVYSSHWPHEYDPTKAALWGLGAALTVLAVMFGIVLALSPFLGTDGSVIVAFVVVALAPRFRRKVFKTT